MCSAFVPSSPRTLDHPAHNAAIHPTAWLSQAAFADLVIDLNRERHKRQIDQGAIDGHQ